jgi:hypothetical protein
MKVLISIALFCFILTLASTAYAHPPQDIIITFDVNTKILHVVIVHNVSNAVNHYIKKVDVSLNGKDIIEHLISRQDNKINQTVSYLIPDAKIADVIGVEGYCSISGKLKKEIRIKR